MYNSRLLPLPERDDPVRLAANAGLSFFGAKIYGQGFVLTPGERDDLIKRDKRNAERIFPYLGGKEVNTSPEQMFHRYVINFGSMTLEGAGRWPELLDIVRQTVKPERDKLRDNSMGWRRRQYWWRYGSEAGGLYEAITNLPKCLVNSQVSKHLVFAFQPTGRVFAHTLYVYPFPTNTQFAILQSRIHEPWARLLSSSMKTDLRYATTDCFETFPFPDQDPRTILPSLEGIGERLYKARAAYMHETSQGLTKTYNALKDPACTAPDIIELRRLHQELDRAVLSAYGWDDIDVPPYTEPDASKDPTHSFASTICDRLLQLNHQRSGMKCDV